MKLHQSNLKLINLKRKKVRPKAKQRTMMIHSLVLCYHSSMQRESLMS